MKELSIEEKAKRYDEALKAAVIAHKDEDRHLKATLERIFHELIESEDERVRKELLSFFTERAKYTEDSTFNGLSSKEIISWLEKQGKQKETLCDKCKKTQPSHSCQDITALGRCALEKQGEQKLTKFEKAVKQVMEEAIECGDTRNLKADADMLLSFVHNSSWSEEDEKLLDKVIKRLHKYSAEDEEYLDKYYWLIELKHRIQPQSTWKPSDEQIEALKDAVSDAIWQYDFKGSPLKEEVTRKHTETIKSLYNDLKKLKG